MMMMMLIKIGGANNTGIAFVGILLSILVVSNIMMLGESFVFQDSTYRYQRLVVPTLNSNLYSPRSLSFTNNRKQQQQQQQQQQKQRQETQKQLIIMKATTTTSTTASVDSFEGNTPNDDSSTVSTAATSTTSSTHTVEDVSDMPNIEPFGVGIVRDYKLRIPYTGSDFKDGLNIQCLAATMFLFFACLAPAVGFGTLYHKATAGAIGTVEVLSSTAGCGILYALLAAQPITIIASTGPVLSFVAALALLCTKMNVPFLPVYAWTGLWTAGLLLISAVTSSSNMVKYLTRFTDEIFSFLISAIFVMNAFTDMWKVFGSTTLTKALLTLVTASSTFIIAYTLKKVRSTVFFNKSLRKVISSFGPTIGVISGALIAKWAVLSNGIATAALPSLTMPSVFGTTTGRDWLIPLFDIPVWIRLACFVPAIMASILLFFDQNITVRLVNNPKWKMTKGRRLNNMIDGMHGDLLIISILVVIQSLLGLPWLIASTVHSVAHVQALANYDRNGNVISTTEQRLTGMAIHGLIGCCVLFANPRKLLSQLSLPVFTGLFLYLGVTGLPGNEMWERIIGVLKDKKFERAKGRWSDTVSPSIVNRYTVIQLLCLALLYGVKESQNVGVLFPVIIAALAPIRILIEKFNIISTKDMEVLDAE
jgi:HCO3- transporter family